MGYRRFVFCILNALITVASLAVLNIGGLTTAHPNYVVTLLATGSSSVSSLGQRTQSEFQIQEVEIADVDKYERAGKCLVILGVFVFGTSLLGWWTWRSMKEPTLTAVKLLVIYTDMLLVLTMVQAGLTGDYLDWYAKIPSRMKDYYETNTIASNYVVGGTDLYSLNVNLLHFLYDCCGIFEADDFQSHNLSSLPPSCCKASIVRGGNLTMQSACISGTADPQYYSQKGCHSQAERKITNNLTAMVIAVTLVLLLQYVLLMAVLATIQVGLTADFYAWLSRLPARMREYYQTNTIASNYHRSSHYDEYSQTVNTLHYVYDCCGIFEHGDFGNPRNLPPSCCKSWIISGGNYSMKYACRQGTAPTDYYSQQGCYEQAQLTIPKNLAIIGSITALILLLQVVQAFLGVLLLRNPENARVAPIEDGQIKPAATSSHLPVVKTPSPSTVASGPSDATPGLSDATPGLHDAIPGPSD